MILRLGFAAALAGLALILGLEVSGDVVPETPAMPGARPPTALSTAPEAALSTAPEATLSRAPEAQAQGPTEWAALISARPLFNPDRRPDLVATPVASETLATLPRLAGILLAPGNHRAVFQPATGEKPISGTEGDNIAGWTITRIARDAVTLTGPNGPVTLYPMADPALAAAPLASQNTPPPATPPPPHPAAAFGGARPR